MKPIKEVNIPYIAHVGVKMNL